MRTLRIGANPVIVLLALAFVLWAAHGAAGAVSIEERFIGNWHLVSFYSYPADGEPVDREMRGRIMYDASGNMAAQLMPNGETDERVVPGYVAYFGTFAVDADAGTVTHSVAGSNFSRWVGTDLIRHFAFEDGRLSLSLKGDDGRVTGTLTWERAD